MEVVVKPLILVAILSLGGPLSQGAAAQHGQSIRGQESALPSMHVRLEAPVGHRQPSIAEIAQGQSSKEFRSPAEIRADEAYRKSEELLRGKLIICRC
jgi:hypothetical protein